jgi:hypothetical protein
MRTLKITLAMSVVAFAAAFVAAAGATITPTMQARLNLTASTIAGKPVTVDCHYSVADWSATVAKVGLTPGPGQYVDAFTYIGTGPVELGDEVCHSLQLPLSKLTTFQEGQVIDVMAHEPNHAFGLRNEAQTEACAHRYEALVIHDLYGIAYHTAKMRLLVSVALQWSKINVIGSYQGGTCPR